MFNWLLGGKKKQRFHASQKVKKNQNMSWLLERVNTCITAHLTSSTFSFLQKKGEQPTGQQRRKHQITYLIHQVSAAKALIILSTFVRRKFSHLLMFVWTYIRTITGHLIFEKLSYCCSACFSHIVQTKSFLIFLSSLMCQHKVTLCQYSSNVVQPAK